MRFVFRTDASTKMGSGHVTRCLTLAENLVKNGADVTFFSRPHSGNLNDMITRKNIGVVELTEPEVLESVGKITEEDNYEEWLSVSREQDADQTIIALGNNKPDWLIVDHYGLDQKWEKALRPYVKKIMVIDDLASRAHDCDLLLDQNWFKKMGTRYEGLVPTGCTKLLGPEYALLRPEFSEARKSLKQRNKKVERIFVFFGGSDPYDLTGMALETLSEPELTYLEVDVVIGENNTHREKIQKLAELRDLTNLHIQVDNMASIMKKSDLAIGSGGSTTWERMCLNLESHVIISAENQKELNEHLNNNNYISLIGYADSMNSNKFRMHIKERISRISFELGSYNFISLCDGDGVSRIIKEMMLIMKDSPKEYFTENA